MAATTLTGTTGNDLLNAPGSVQTLVQGLQGNDTINLSLATDEAQAGEGNDSIGLTRSGIVDPTIFGGAGNDTVFVQSAAQFNGYVDLGKGTDSIAISSATTAIGGNIFGGEGADTISLRNALTNTTIGAGSGNDVISRTGGGTSTNVLIFGGKQKDTITLNGAAAGTFTSIGGGKGNDVIQASGIAAQTSSSLIGGGQGEDSIRIGTTAVNTVAGGGLNDTIRLVGAYAGGRVYGDGKGTTTVGTGTDGAADGADSISNSAGFAAAAASIYGGGGKDTINLIAGSAVLIDAGNGFDSINLRGLATSNYGNGTITGGAGNDTLSVSVTAVAVGAARSALGTITGGDGTDLIIIGATTAGLLVSANDTLMSGNANAVISGASGDTLRVFTSVATSNFGGAGNANWFNNTGASPTFLVLTAASGQASAAGTAYGLSVFSDGTDSIIQLYNSAAASTYSRYYIKGSDLVTTTSTGAVSASTTAFAFTVAANSGGGINIAFS